MDIVIVGNGPSLLGSNLGHKIDQYCHVVRFNNYVTSGYESDVGSKVTIWSKWYGLNVERPTESLDTIWVNMPTQDRTAKRISQARAILGEAAGKLEIIPSVHVANKLQTEVYKGLEGMFWPSSGLLAIGHAIDMGYNVTIAGIDSWESKPYHYYEEHDRSKSHHVKELEAVYIKALVNEKRVLKIQ